MRRRRQRQQKPQLATGVWQWLTGTPYEELSFGTKCDLVVLEPVRKDDLPVREFWRRIEAAVLAGEIEISDDKVHKVTDPPLLISAAV